MYSWQPTHELKNGSYKIREKIEYFMGSQSHESFLQYLTSASKRCRGVLSSYLLRLLLLKNRSKHVNSGTHHLWHFGLICNVYKYNMKDSMSGEGTKMLNEKLLKYVIY